jgi:hypothetical protein
MRADETIGVAAAARLLRCLCDTREATVAEQAKAVGIRRSTAFVVAAGLEATGLAERDSRGRLRAGPAATRLSLAYYGFGAMADAVEALLPVLRDDTDTCVSLIISKGASQFEAVRRRAAWAPLRQCLRGACRRCFGRNPAGVGPAFVTAAQLAIRPAGTKMSASRRRQHPARESAGRAGTKRSDPRCGETADRNFHTSLQGKPGIHGGAPQAGVAAIRPGMPTN